jgi:hypothetical protein
MGRGTIRFSQFLAPHPYCCDEPMVDPPIIISALVYFRRKSLGRTFIVGTTDTGQRTFPSTTTDKPASPGSRSCPYSYSIPEANRIKIFFSTST